MSSGQRGMYIGSSAQIATGFLPTKVLTLTKAGATEQSFDFTGLDINTDGVYLIEFSIKKAEAGDEVGKVEINADTTVTNYNSQSQYTAGAVISAGLANNNSAFAFYASTIAVGRFYIYRDVAGYARIATDLIFSPSASVKLYKNGVCTVGTVANITEVKFVVAGHFDTGSTMTLYKFPR